MPGGSPEWHFSPGDTARIERDENRWGHGSCVASKAAGRMTGVSKRSRLVIMKSDNYIKNELSAFESVLKDVMEKKRQRRAVVLYARSSHPKRFILDDVERSNIPLSWYTINILMTALGRQNVGVVVGAGNNVSLSTSMDTLPGMWLYKKLNSLIVVGSVTNGGDLAEFSQGVGEDILWAPGDQIICASGPTASGTRSDSGTSLSAAMVCFPKSKWRFGLILKSNLGCRSDCVSVGTPWWAPGLPRFNVKLSKAYKPNHSPTTEQESKT